MPLSLNVKPLCLGPLRLHRLHLHGRGGGRNQGVQRVGVLGSQSPQSLGAGFFWGVLTGGPLGFSAFRAKNIRRERRNTTKKSNNCQKNGVVFFCSLRFLETTGSTSVWHRQTWWLQGAQPQKKVAEYFIMFTLTEGGILLVPSRD